MASSGEPRIFNKLNSELNPLLQRVAQLCSLSDDILERDKRAILRINVEELASVFEEYMLTLPEAGSRLSSKDNCIIYNSRRILMGFEIIIRFKLTALLRSFGTECNRRGPRGKKRTSVHALVAADRETLIQSLPTVPEKKSNLSDQALRGEVAMQDTFLEPNLQELQLPSVPSLQDPETIREVNGEYQSFQQRMREVVSLEPIDFEGVVSIFKAINDVQVIPEERTVEIGRTQLPSTTRLEITSGAPSILINPASTTIAHTRDFLDHMDQLALEENTPPKRRRGLVSQRRHMHHKIVSLPSSRVIKMMTYDPPEILSDKYVEPDDPYGEEIIGKQCELVCNLKKKKIMLSEENVLDSHDVLTTELLKIFQELGEMRSTPIELSSISPFVPMIRDAPSSYNVIAEPAGIKLDQTLRAPRTPSFIEPFPILSPILPPPQMDRSVVERNSAPDIGDIADISIFPQPVAYITASSTSEPVIEALGLSERFNELEGNIRSFLGEKLIGKHSSVTFAELCPPEETDKVTTAKSFQVLLSLWAAKEISIDQTSISPQHIFIRNGTDKF